MMLSGIFFFKLLLLVGIIYLVAVRPWKQEFWGKREKYYEDDPKTPLAHRVGKAFALREREENGLRGERSTESNIELDPRVTEALLQAAPEGRITCPAARELAEQLGVDPGVIGQACNQLRIKIKGCTLGCFK